MPHIIIEHDSQTLNAQQASAIVSAAFTAVEKTQLFNPDNIKVRTHATDFFQLAEANSGFIHCQCRIHAGKTDHQKTQLTQALLQTLGTQVHRKTVITVEVVEMNTACYAKGIFP